MDLYTLASNIQLIEIGQSFLIDNWENLKAYNSSIYDIRGYDCQFLADKFNFPGGQIDNVIWKSEINEIIHG